MDIRTTARRSALASASCLAFGIVVGAQADQVALEPAKDNTLFSTGNTSNGAGPQFFSGRTGFFAGYTLQRAVLEFDIAGAVPAGATITGVSLTLHLERTSNDTDELHSLHRMLAEWGEGTSASGGGTGALATAGDATWLHTYYPDQFWTAEGGDSSSVISASQMVPIQDIVPIPVTWDSTPELVADVQLWLDDPDQNHGWMLTGNETGDRTARKFSSREHDVVSQRPRLTITYDLAPPCPADFDGDGRVTVADLLRVVHAMGDDDDTEADLNGDGRVTVQDLLMVIQSFGPCPDAPPVCVGDVNDDGVVDVRDLLSVVHAFGATGDRPEDLNDDGVVSVSDLLTVIQNFGPCPG